jgi:predicted DNA-binding transcriptional regulator AlpA
MALEAAMALATDDEWWTTDRVCAHLKLSKRALWDLRVHPTKAFPAAIKPGGKINLFRADEVRAWLAARRPANMAVPAPINSIVVELTKQSSEQPPAKEIATPEPAQALVTTVEKTKPVSSEKVKAQPRKARPVAKNPLQLDLF